MKTKDAFHPKYAEHLRLLNGCNWAIRVDIIKEEPNFHHHRNHTTNNAPKEVQMELVKKSIERYKSCRSLEVNKSEMQLSHLRPGIPIFLNINLKLVNGE